jgi:hypothetical protein
MFHFDLTIINFLNLLKKAEAMVAKGTFFKGLQKELKNRREKRMIE